MSDDARCNPSTGWVTDKPDLLYKVLGLPSDGGRVYSDPGFDCFFDGELGNTPNPHGKGSLRWKGNVLKRRCLLADWDYGSRQEICNFLLKRDLPPRQENLKGDPRYEQWRSLIGSNRGALPIPTAIAYTGGPGTGIHAWWAVPDGITDLDRWSEYMELLAGGTGGDPAMANPCGVVRRPCQVYEKQGLRGKPGFLRVDPEMAVFTEGEIYRAIEELAQPERQAEAKPMPCVSAGMDVTRAELDQALSACEPRRHGNRENPGNYDEYKCVAWGLVDGYLKLGLSLGDAEETLLRHSPNASEHERDDIKKLVADYRRGGGKTYKTLLYRAKQKGSRPPRMKAPEQRPMRQTATTRAPSISAADADPDELRQQVLEFAEPQYNLATQTWLSRGEPARFVELTAEQMHRGGYGRLTEKGGLVRWPKQNAIDAFKAVGLENRFHPVQDYLAGLKEAHRRGELEPVNIEDLAARYLKAPDSLSNRMLACWLVGAVKRQRRPGCKHDSMLVIQGDQGARKSSFFETLAGREPGFFASGTETVNMSKDGLLNLHRAWIHEVAELRNSQRELDSVKAFLSRQVDNFRPPYAAIAEDHPRASVFAATTNRDIFLSDPTGNRRFMVISTPCTKEHPIDTELLEAERDGIWLGALLAERDGHRNWLTPEELKSSEERNQDHMATDVDAERLEELLCPEDGLPVLPESFSMSELLDKFGVDRDGKPCPASDGERRRLPNKLGRLLKDLGYENQQNRRDGKKAVRWAKKNQPPFKL